MSIAYAIGEYGANLLLTNPAASCIVLAVASVAMVAFATVRLKREVRG